MKKLILFFIIILSPFIVNAGELDSDFSSSLDNKDTFLKPLKKDAYGLGIHSDATGRPFKWHTQDGDTDPLLDVKPDAYGPGIGKDQYGRPVKPKAWP